MLNATIKLTGRTINDLDLALTEALSRIQENNTSGFDSNDTGSFSFELSGEEGLFLVENEDGDPLYLTRKELTGMTDLYNQTSGKEAVMIPVVVDDDRASEEDELRNKIYQFAIEQGFELEEVESKL